MGSKTLKEAAKNYLEQTYVGNTMTTDEDEKLHNLSNADYIMRVIFEKALTNPTLNAVKDLAKIAGEQNDVNVNLSGSIDSVLGDCFIKEDDESK